MKKSLLETFSSLFAGSDEDAMGRVQRDGDSQAFAQLVRRWQVPIERLCTRMLGDPHRGEDLAQDTFARLFARRKDYQPTGRFSTFLWRVAMNLCYDELRRRKRRPETSLDLLTNDSADNIPEIPAVAPGPDATLAAQEQGDIVRAAVQALPELYRSVVVLRHYENLKFREIADVLGIPEGTVKSRMAEALDQLHRTLTRSFHQQPSTLCNSKYHETSLVL